MNCPYGKVVEGERCGIAECWMWNPKAQESCMVVDTGSTHLTDRDLARVSGEPLSHVRARVERGRAKLAAWLALLDLVESTDADGGCPRCGSESCGGKTCNDVLARRSALADQLPLDEFVTMSKTRWAAALAAQKKLSVKAAFLINR
jgi:hypothetical protein